MQLALLSSKCFGGGLLGGLGTLDAPGKDLASPDSSLVRFGGGPIGGADKPCLECDKYDFRACTTNGSGCRIFI